MEVTYLWCVHYEYRKNINYLYERSKISKSASNHNCAFFDLVNHNAYFEDYKDANGFAQQMRKFGREITFYKEKQEIELQYLDSYFLEKLGNMEIEDNGKD